jgi:hypothetical protein
MLFCSDRNLFFLVPLTPKLNTEFQINYSYSDFLLCTKHNPSQVTKYNPLSLEFCQILLYLLIVLFLEFSVISSSILREIFHINTGITAGFIFFLTIRNAVYSIIP